MCTNSNYLFINSENMDLNVKYLIKNIIRKIQLQWKHYLRVIVLDTGHSLFLSVIQRNNLCKKFYDFFVFPGRCGVV